MHYFKLGLFSTPLILAISTSYAQTPLATVEVDDSLIAANVLCQNVPDVAEDQNATEVYLSYLNSVDQLFSNRANHIRKGMLGTSKDKEIQYTLSKPVSIVGISFNQLAISDITDDSFNYYQVSAIKPSERSDASLISNIPQDDKVTVSTTNNQLKISCNIRAEKYPK